MKTTYYNGRVYCGKGSFASSFTIENGRFINVGAFDHKPDISAADRIVDLKGAFVCPGFNDSHMHLLNYGQILSFAPLYEHTGSMGEMLDCLRDFMQKRADKKSWLLGRGWNQDLFSDEKRMPTRWDLDTVSEEIPIMITRACGHCCVLNSKALEIVGITSSTVSPEGGRIGSNEGVPDGRLFDNAMDLLVGKKPSPSIGEIKEMIRLACKALNGYGITSVQTDDYCVFRELPWETVNEAYRELESCGELSIRIYEQCNFTELDELKRFVGEGNKTGIGSEMFKLGPLKLLGDGALGSRTAHLSEPYNGTEEFGFSLFSPEHLKEMVSFANNNGIQAAIHAIGDACLDEALDAIESALAEHPKPDHRHGIIHCQVSRPDQLLRMIRLGVHIYAQSIFLDYDNHIVKKLLSEKLYGSSYNWKTLMNGGLSVSNGSDCPVELPDVMRGIECAVTRESFDGAGPYLIDQGFSVEEALDSFTINGAEASFEEGFKGRISPGYAADFVILDEDPFKVDAHALHNIGIRETYLGGKRVFQLE